MPDDNIPQSSSSALSQFVDRLNLPQMIAGPAGKAISRLIAGVVEIPAAYLDSFAQSIKDKTTARSVLNKAVVDAASKFAATDEMVIQRAAHNLLAKEFRHQANKEAVAVKALEILRTEDAPETSPPDVDLDWLNVFERYAENASSERLQELWGRILAGEIRKPKSFSLKTLRFVSELDQKIATTFERCSSAILGRRFIPTRSPLLKGPAFDELLDLQDYDLVSGVGGLLQSTLTTSTGTITLESADRIIVINGEKEFELQISSVTLTRMGIEVLNIVKPVFDMDQAKSFVESLDKTKLTEIFLGTLVKQEGPKLHLTQIVPLWHKLSG
jgi:Protein of unknown function (DUF2806)